MRCSDCGLEITALPCERCESEHYRHEENFRQLIEEFGLTRGTPENAESRAHIDFAVAKMKEHLQREAFKGKIAFDPADILLCDRWCYIPCSWIGCAGFIVNLNDGYVNWLGSALSLRECIWGHERGVYSDLIDIEFAPDTDREVAMRIFKRFQFVRPTSDGQAGSDGETTWYRESEIPIAFAEQFPIFRRHFAWFAIPELYHAWRNEGLSFGCSLPN